MSISSVGQTGGATAVSSVSSGGGRANRASSIPPPPQADKVSVSKRSGILSELKALASSDPAKFKEVTKAISDKLKAAADAATDPTQKKMLTDMADKFAKAADTGDFSSLEPAQKAKGAHGHHHHGGPPPGASDAESIISSVLDATKASSASAPSASATAATAPA